MEIKTLERVNKTEILNVFNRSFSDYFIPFKLTKEQLLSKMLVDKTDLNLSVGVFEEGKLIAFILHGLDIINSQKMAYNGGTGVIPEKRGSGLTKQMYHFILPYLAERGINKLILEVINENIQAIKSYEKTGFITKRELVCYKGIAKTSNLNKNIEVKNLLIYHWNSMETFWDVLPTWQNSNSALDVLKQNNCSLGAYIENQLIGYIIYNPTNKRIQQIAVQKDFRKKGIASTLIFELIKKYGNTFSIINVDKKSKEVNHFLNKIGLENSLEQIEMELKLNKNYS
jgi:ribosomal protein S18 acetylase RimI-like enzyme